MRLYLSLLFVVASGSWVAGQTLSLKPPTVQYVTVATSTSKPAVMPGGSVTLWVDVTPKPNIHVYAVGARDVMPPTLVLTPAAHLSASKPIYPPGERVLTVGADTPQPIYRKLFRILQPVTIDRSAPSGQSLTIAAALNYQACDDKLCYPPSAIPLLWTLTIR